MRTREAATSIRATIRAVAKTAGKWSVADRERTEARSDSATMREAVPMVFSCGSDIVIETRWVWGDRRKFCGVSLLNFKDFYKL